MWFQNVSLFKKAAETVRQCFNSTTCSKITISDADYAITQV